MLIALLFGQAHGLIAHGHDFSHRHIEGMVHAIVQDTHDVHDASIEAGGAEHDHRLSLHAERIDDTTLDSPPTIEYPAILPNPVSTSASALRPVRARIPICLDAYPPNGPPNIHPSRAPPASTIGF